MSARCRNCGTFFPFAGSVPNHLDRDCRLCGPDNALSPDLRKAVREELERTKRLPKMAPETDADLPSPQELHVYTAEEFEALTEREPEGDDLYRLNCPDAGLPGHLQCGACIVHQMPRFMCGCVARVGAPTDLLPAVEVITDPEWDPNRTAVDMERILWWPGLDAFPGMVTRLRSYRGSVNSPEVRASMGQVVRRLLHELRQRGVLRRDLNGAWRYDGRGR